MIHVLARGFNRRQDIYCHGRARAQPHGTYPAKTSCPMPISPEQPIPFAAVDHRFQRGRVFGIQPADLLRHVHVLGKTGMGKSVLLEHLFLGLVARGEGCGLIDPHGDLADRVLDLIPRHRTNDVVLLDAADLDQPVSLNPLDYRSPRERLLVVPGVLGVFQKVFHEFWGPRMEHVFRCSLLALLDTEEPTLFCVLRMLVEDAYRAKVVARINDPIVLHYWTREFPAYGAAFAAEVVAPVQNKVAAVLTSPVLRGILAQGRSTFRAQEVMDHGRIFIAKVAKGEIGEHASAMLGAVLTTAFQLAAYARAARPPADRRPFTLLIDEFASFSTRSFGELLAEARKYGLGLVLSHQYLAQLDDELRAAVMGNAGTTIAFRLGADDATAVGEEFRPEVDASTLTQLDRHQIALRLAVQGVSTPAFTATTLAPVADLVGHGDIIRRVSAERYAGGGTEAGRMRTNSQVPASSILLRRPGAGRDRPS